MIYFSNASQVVQDSISKLKSYNKSELDKLRDKCIDYYQYSNTKSYIDDYFGGTLQDEIPLYTTNMTRRLIERISLVYKEPPLRGIEDENYALYTEDKDYMLKKIERMHNLLGTIALHICWNENGKFFSSTSSISSLGSYDSSIGVTTWDLNRENFLNFKSIFTVLKSFFFLNQILTAVM